MKEYERWLASPVLTDEERKELEAIRGDRDEVESRFYAPLEFGTAGLRGVMGMGIARMNIYVVMQTTQAMANLVLREKGEKRGVAVAHDCRINSRRFAEAAAEVLAANGVNVLLFESLRPTPELSFAIRKYGCIAGINITASHNPKEYNGYKAYWEDGAQLPPEPAETVEKENAKIDVLTGAKRMPLEEAKAAGLVRILGDETDEAFLDCALGEAIDLSHVATSGLSIVYTPFHGCGYKLVPEALRRAGFSSIYPVAEQMVIDGNFPTVVSPNPENPEGFALAVELAGKVGATFILGTDPDSDRVGVMARAADGSFRVLSGNQTGSLLLDYIINARKKCGKMPEKPFAVGSIVSSDMPRVIAEANGVEYYKTFTGFKFIAECINENSALGKTCIFSFEESFGYLIGDFCRDKDAVTASLLLCEMASSYAARNMTLIDGLEELYRRYGAFAEKTISKVMPGLDGAEKMAKLMEELREGRVALPGALKLIGRSDYLTGKSYDIESGEWGEMELRDSNVLEYRFEGGSKILIRPSGTEPKIKFYILARGETMERAEEIRSTLEKFVGEL